MLDVDATALPPKYRGTQPFLIDTWYATESQEEVMRRVGLIKQHVKSFGIDPLQNPSTRVGIYALTGDTGQAVDVALNEVFSQPVTANLDYPDKLAQSYLVPVISDPRVAEAIERWDAEKSGQRRDVARFLAEFGDSG